MPIFYCRKKKTHPKDISSDKPKRVKQNRRKPITKCKRKERQKFNFYTTLWRDILTEDDEIENYIKKKEQENLPSFQCESKYIAEKLFPTLISAFRRMCAITLRYRAHCREVRFFSFLDYLAEILWNTNNKHPERRNSWKSIYLVNANQPFYKSRTFYKYRLFLTPDEAATIIQSRIRGHQTRLKYNLVEMKVERAKIMEAKGKQRECFNAHKDAIVNIRNCVFGEPKSYKTGYRKQ